MTTPLFEIQNGKFGLSLTDPGTMDVCAATIGDYMDFTCRVSDGALNATPNTSTETVPASWCDPEQTIPVVGETSYSADFSAFQDPQFAAGLAAFLMQHDAEEAWFYLGLDLNDPPKAIGKCRLTAQTFGGPARSPLTATLTFPVVGKPSVCFGDSTTSIPVNDPGDLTAAIFGQHPAPFADRTALAADPTYGDGNLGWNGGADFATGEYVQTQDGYAVGTISHYASGVWAAGRAA